MKILIDESINQIIKDEKINTTKLFFKKISINYNYKNIEKGLRDRLIIKKK